AQHVGGDDGEHTHTTRAETTAATSRTANVERLRHVRPGRPKARPSIAIASVVARLIETTSRTKTALNRLLVRRASEPPAIPLARLAIASTCHSLTSRPSSRPA